MPTENETYTTYQNGWMLRVRPPQNPDNARLLLLLHGWTGDENVMWVFARNIGGNYAVVAPRGPVDAPNGFGWVNVQGDDRGSFDGYAKAGEELLSQIGRWTALLNLPLDPEVDLMGFSQGAALAYSILLRNPSRIGKTAGLSGFLPHGYQEAVSPGLLAGKQVFVAHGTEDNTVPLAEAQEVVSVLEEAGAQVVYCEEDVGHKLGAACYNGLKSFFG